jgi:hypothetical protein
MPLASHARALAAAAILALPPVLARAVPPTQENRTVNVNYVYASTLGFGGYSLAGLTASVYTLPLAHTFQLDGTNGLALRVTLPVQLGLYSFRAIDTSGAPISIDQQSIAVVPGVALPLTVAPRTVITPFANFGAGHTFGVTEGGADALIYSFGVRGTNQHSFGAYTLTLGAAVLYAGDSTIGGGFNESYTALEAGAELRRPLGFTIGPVKPDVGIYVATYYYPNALEFSRFLEPPLLVRNQGEVGFTIGSAKPLDLPVLANARVGAGYVFGDGLRVWHVVFGFPF